MYRDKPANPEKKTMFRSQQQHTTIFWIDAQQGHWDHVSTHHQLRRTPNGTAADPGRQRERRIFGCRFERGADSAGVAKYETESDERFDCAERGCKMVFGIELGWRVMICVMGYFVLYFPENSLASDTTGFVVARRIGIHFVRNLVHAQGGTSESRRSGWDVRWPNRDVCTLCLRNEVAQTAVIALSLQDWRRWLRRQQERIWRCLVCSSCQRRDA